MNEEFIKQHSVEIAKYILDSITYFPEIVMSWGIIPESLKAIIVDDMPGLEFHTQGYKHNGLVQVLLNEGADTFEVRLLNDSEELVSKTEDVYLQELTNTIDNLVEKTDDYVKRVFEDYLGA